MSLIVWIPAIDSTLDDKIGHPLTTTISLPGYNSAGGKLGGCYSFSSHNIRITGLKATGSMTFALWINFSRVASCHILDFRHSSGESGYQPIYYNTSSGVQIYSSSAPHGDYIATGVLSANTWYHLAVVIDSGVGSLYLNGTYKGQVSIGNPNCNTELTLGSRCSGGSRFTGAMNDIRIYDHALSKKEIKELSKGLICHYKLDACNNTNLLLNSGNPSFDGYISKSSGSIVFDNILQKNVFECSNTATSEKFIFYSNRFPIVGGESYTFSCDVYCNDYFKNMDVFLLSSSTLAVNSTSSSFDNPAGIKSFNRSKTSTEKLISGQWVHISGTFTPNSDQTSAYVRIDNNGSSTSGSAAVLRVANCKLERGSKSSPFGINVTESTHNTIEPDSSGYNHNGTKYDISSYTSDTPRNGSTTYFNGIKSYIEFKNFKPALPNEDYTISFWINPKENNIRDVIFGNHTNSTHSFNIERHEANDLRIYYNGDTPGRLSDITMPANAWTHIVIVRSGNTIQVWKNGVCSLNQSYTLTTISCTNTNWKIGSDYRTGETSSEATRLNGYLSDFRIYATALQEVDIKELYNTSWAANKQGQVFSGTVSENKSNFQITRGGVNNCLNIQETGCVPEGYQPLHYLYSADRSRCIDTGATFNLNTDKVEIDFQSADATGNYFIAGCGVGGTNAPYLWIYQYPSGSTFSIYADTGSGQKAWHSGNQPDANRHVVILDKKIMYYDGTSRASNSTVSFSNNLSNFCLFDSCTSGSGYSAKVKIYSCKIWHSDVLVRNLIPVKRKSDGALGFFDTVGCTFYGETAGRSLVAGPQAVSQSRDGSLYCAEFNEI